MPGERKLPEIVQALRPVSLRLGVGKRRQQHRSQDGDDRDDDQQFDQRERIAAERTGGGRKNHRNFKTI